MAGATTRLTRPRRYQLKKGAVQAVRRGHPWIFRKQMSSAASVFPDGQWLRLVDGANAVVGYGVYEPVGAVAVRVLKRGSEPPRGAFIHERLRSALALRSKLRESTDAFRAVHGENDGLPALAIDVYADVAVVQTYLRGADILGRLVARYLVRECPVEGILFRPAARRRDKASRARTLYGRVPSLVHFHEDDQTYAVDPWAGQKTGAFLDLRGLRRRLGAGELEGKRILSLFSYTGTLGAGAERAGAREIWQVDASRAALDFARTHHVGSAGRHRFVEADAFAWAHELDKRELFDLVVVDPPQMTSRKRQVPRALAAYDRLYRKLSTHVAPGGRLIACCCTSRIDAETFQTTVSKAIGHRGRFVDRLPPEVDHPVRFRQADYLKILIYRFDSPGEES